MSGMTLEEASLELDDTTPERYLEIMDYIHTLENRQGLPEAPASVNFRMKTKDGIESQFTLRDMDEGKLLRRFALLIDATKQYGGDSLVKRGEGETAAQFKSSEARISSEVDASVIDGANVEGFEVTELVFNMGNKTNFLMVKGGVWTKFGWRAYPEVVPTDVPYDTWPAGESVSEIPPQMQYAWVDKTDGKRKIVAFGTLFN